MWVNPRTWVAGELVTAAQLNAQLRDNLIDLDGRAAQALAFDATQLGNGASASESVLFTYTIPANTLDVTGKTVYLKAVGVFATDDSSKNVRIRVGGLSGTMTAFIGGSTATNGRNFWIEAYISRLAGSSQRLFGDGYYAGSEGTVGQRLPIQTTSAHDSGTPIAVVVTGEAGSGFANEIVYICSWAQTLK